MNNFAYITLVSTSADFIKGALCLQESLKKVGSKYHLVTLVTDDLAGHADLKYIDDCRIVPYKMFKYDGRYNCTINKLWMLTLTEFDRLMFIDADVFVSENLDFMFDKYRNYNFVGRIHINRGVENRITFEGGIFILKPIGKDYIESNMDAWEQMYVTDEDILGFEIFPYYKETFTTMDFPDYINKYFHSYEEPKYFRAFKSCDEILAAFARHDAQRLHQIFKSWYRTLPR